MASKMTSTRLLYLFVDNFKLLYFSGYNETIKGREKDALQIGYVVMFKNANSSQQNYGQHTVHLN